MAKKQDYRKKKRTESKSRSSNPPSTSISSTSLQQQLKKYRGVAASTSAPPPFQWRSDERSALGSSNNFLTPQNDPKSFERCVKSSYAGFYHDGPDDLPSSLHRDFDSSFEGMESGQFVALSHLVLFHSF